MGMWLENILGWAFQLLLSAGREGGSWWVASHLRHMRLQLGSCWASERNSHCGLEQRMDPLVGRGLARRIEQEPQL